ncbi:ABC transporter ATP-binding protein [Alicyclobacillus sp. ALC3]|uniref:ABC transporter ATP-binding protein n=1 Tax=Alicyclobacillus sp. ALC3 TaxID=2796143 RepID=UPI00237973D6|nr:ABC transporter ATP-binding protein [Alicyclobacillus sp. ALC3]WDL96012.1 ABC transporter ATP-binding protein [Alicyclobacillus sp. ALC3]
MTDPAIEVHGLTKRYGTLVAVDGIDLEVQRGEVFGLLGPNGAGKTTVLECLEGIRRPDAGQIRVAGCDPQANTRALRRKLGVQLQVSSLPGHMRVSEAISLVCAWHGVPVRAGLIESFGVETLMNRMYGKLSTGQQRRLHLLLALVIDPAVLVLDEPTAGLDVQSRLELHAQIRAAQSRGVTVLLATHDMAEAEKLCDRIAIILHGKLVLRGSPSEVALAGNKAVQVRIRTANDSLMPGSDLPGAVFTGAKDGYLAWRSTDLTSTLTELLNYVKSVGDTIEDLRVEHPSLEERFIQVVEGVVSR